METNNDILKKVHSGDPELLAEAVKEIQENGDLSIARTLLEELKNIREPHTMTTVVNLLADIKESPFREIVIHQLQATSQPAVKVELLRVIWESSLDYSHYLPVFLEILKEDDFPIAFEASTVIENMVHSLTDEQYGQLHEFIKTFPEDKHFLIENIHAEMGCHEHD